MIGIANGSTGPVDVIVDIVGYFDDNSLEFGLRYHALPNGPTRIVDTRGGVGIAHPLGTGQTQLINPAPTGDSMTWALNYNVTAVGPTNSTYLTLWPDFISSPIPRPGTSNLNALAGQGVASHAMPSAGDSNLVNIYNRAGTTNVLVDVTGTYESWPLAFPGSASPAIAAARTTQTERATQARTATAVLTHPSQSSSVRRAMQ